MANDLGLGASGVTYYFLSNTNAHSFSIDWGRKRSGNA